MSEPLADPHGVRGRELRLRASVRAIAAKLAAAEHALRRDLRRNDDPELRVLAAALAGERRAVAALGAELDERIARTAAACRALDAAALSEVVESRRTVRMRAE